jgi:hypothetical protein
MADHELVAGVVHFEAGGAGLLVGIERFGECFDSGGGKIEPDEPDVGFVRWKFAAELGEGHRRDMIAVEEPVISDPATAPMRQADSGSPTSRSGVLIVVRGSVRG